MISFEIELYQLAIVVSIQLLVWFVVANYNKIMYHTWYKWQRPIQMDLLGQKIAHEYMSSFYFVAVESKPVVKFRKLKMTESDIKNVLYGSIRELSRNRTYFYDSSYRPHWTDEGKRVVGEMLDMYAEKITQAIKEADEQRSKDMVMNTLKEESK